MKIIKATSIGHLYLAGKTLASDSLMRQPVAEASDADVAERLFAEFEPTVGLSMLSDVVRRCRVARRAAAARSVPHGGASSLEELAREAIASFLLASSVATLS